MKILALEFSTLRRDVALLDGPKILSESSEEARRGGSPFPLIARVLGNTPFHEIQAIAVGLGPGSYTGIRSSLAIAQGWHLAHNISAAGVSSADAIAFEAWKSGLCGPIEVAIDAQRKEIYSAGYNLTEEKFELTKPLEILSKPAGYGVLISADSDNPIFPLASAVGLLSQRLVFGPPENLEAIYLREPSFVKAPAPAPLA